MNIITLYFLKNILSYAYRLRRPDISFESFPQKKDLEFFFDIFFKMPLFSSYQFEIAVIAFLDPQSCSKISLLVGFKKKKILRVAFFFSKNETFFRNIHDLVN